jgi:hypothetical protein
MITDKNPNKLERKKIVLTPIVHESHIKLPVIEPVAPW